MGLLTTLNPDYSPLQNPGLQVVASRGILPGLVLSGGGGTNYTLGESRYPVKVANCKVADLRLLLTGFYLLSNGSGESDNPFDINIRAAIEQVSPAIAPRTHYAGTFDILLRKGIGHILSESLGISTAAGETLYVQLSSYVNSGETWPASQLSGSNSAQYVSTLAAASSQVGTPGAFSAASRAAGYTYSATALIGIPDKPIPSVAILGDSIADGAGETGTGDNNGNYGWVCRGLWNVGSDNSAIPYMRLTRAGDGALSYFQGKGQRRLALLRYVSHVIVQLGVNDAAGNDLSACQARLQFLWTACKTRGKKVYQCLLTPYTTSTDSFATAANQTPVTAFAVGGVRDQLNSWIISQVGQGLLDGVINPNPYVEDANSPGKWISNGTANYATSDGIHPSSTLHALAAQAVNQWAQGIT